MTYSSDMMIALTLIVLRQPLPRLPLTVRDLAAENMRICKLWKSYMKYSIPALYTKVIIIL